MKPADVDTYIDCVEHNDKKPKFQVAKHVTMPK